MTDNFQDLESLWHSTRLQESGRGDAAADAAFSRFRKNIRSGGHAVRWWALRVAAALFVPCAVFSIYSAIRLNDKTNDSAAIKWIQEEVPAGQIRHLSLPDGTSVMLSSGSRLIYPDVFQKADRQVFFCGEGYFEVQSDPDHPFVIGMEDGSVEVTGTEFNLRSFRDDASVAISLYEGKVRFNYTNSIGNGAEYILHPGEHVEFSKTGGTLSSSFFKGREYSNWMNGDYLFKDKPLVEIARQLERIYGVNVVIRNARLAETPYYLAISGGQSIDDIVALLCMDGHLHTRRSGNIIEIY